MIKTRERIELHLIDPNPWQPRQAMDGEAVEDIAGSINRIGLLQVPLGRRNPSDANRIQLAFGHTRVDGLILLHERGQWPSYVEMDVATLTDEEMAMIALTENEVRKQLSQIEVVRAHKKAIDETNLTAQDLATRIGIDRSTLANNLRVLNLPDFVLEHVESGDLKLNVARAFLVLQTATHAHLEDMREVIRRIVNVERYGGGVPDWRRSHVRKLISERVSYNEQDWRPLGPKTGSSTGGGHREAGFDVDAFEFEFRDSLHTIPADDGHVENHRPTERYDKGRVWTCEVKEWSRRQSRATREANKDAAASGKAGKASQTKAPSRDKLFEQLLANDPVWKEVVATRGNNYGPKRPVTAEEKAALGTRAEFKEVSYSTKFWKILQKGNPENVHNWERKDGGHVPPWFPDLGECQRCTIGASYAKSNGYPLDKPALVCFNREHYDEKYAAGEAAYREKLEAQRRGIDRQDRDAVDVIADNLLLVPESISQALAFALLSAQPALEWEHAMGRFHPDWSREPAVVALVREIIGKEYARFDRSGRTGPVKSDPPQDLPVSDVRELAAALVTHHLRQAGQLDTVSRETAAPPDPLAVREILTGETAAAEVRS